MIGDEIGLTGHLLTGVVDIGDRGLPTRSHGKMREVIDLISRLQGCVELGPDRALGDDACSADP